MKEEIKEKVIKNHRCILCGKTNTEQIDSVENSMGELVMICRCIDCDIEFEVKS